RFALPGLTPDVKIGLGRDSFFGPYFALSMGVAPGAPHTLGVSRAVGGVSPAAQGGVVIYDDSTARPVLAPTTFNLFCSIVWGADATQLFAANNESTGFDFYTLVVDSNGVALDKDYGGAFNDFSNRIH